MEDGVGQKASLIYPMTYIFSWPHGVRRSCVTASTDIWTMTFSIWLCVIRLEGREISKGSSSSVFSFFLFWVLELSPISWLAVDIPWKLLALFFHVALFGISWCVSFGTNLCCIVFISSSVDGYSLHISLEIFFVRGPTHNWSLRMTKSWSLVCSIGIHPSSTLPWSMRVDIWFVSIFSCWSISREAEPAKMFRVS